MKKQIIITIIICIVCCFFVWTGCLRRTFSHGMAGSYPYVETWSFKVKEDELIEIIKEIKKEYPELNMDTSNFRDRYWYYFTFYYKETNEDVQTWVRGNNDGLTTTFALVALSTHEDSLTPVEDIKMDRREINKDFGYFENRREINKFEERIVGLIEEKIAARTSHR